MMRLLLGVSIWRCHALWPSLSQIVCFLCLRLALYFLSISTTFRGERLCTLIICVYTSTLRFVGVIVKVKKKLFSGPSSTGWAKNRTCLSVDNSAMVTVERPVICQKFWNVVDKESLTCIANHLNILRLICVNLHCPWN